MVQGIIHDPLLLAQKSEPATENITFQLSI